MNNDRNPDVIASLVEHARQAGQGSGPADELTAAVRDASPDERSAAAQEISEDRPAYEALHQALKDAGVAPTEPASE